MWVVIIEQILSLGILWTSAQGHIVNINYIFSDDTIDVYYINDAYQLKGINDSRWEDYNFNHSYKFLMNIIKRVHEQIW